MRSTLIRRHARRALPIAAIILILATLVVTARVGLSVATINDPPDTPLHSEFSKHEEDLTIQPFHRDASESIDADSQSFEDRLRVAISQCDRDRKNNVDKHVGCFLIRDAVIVDDRVRYDPQLNPGLPAQFPGPLSARSRHHMRSIDLQPWHNNNERDRVISGGNPSTPLTVRNVTFGYYQAPVIGGQYRNAWHTFGDFFTMLHHTVAPLIFEGNSTSRAGAETVPPMWWLTRTARTTLGKDCNSHAACRRWVLFDPFEKLFENRVAFIDTQPQRSQPLFVSYLLIGINSRCSPIPTDGVDTEECHHNLELVRDRVLSMYNLGPQRAVSTEERECPVVHVMSRQGDQYRHLTPFDVVLAALKEEFEGAFPGCPASNLHVIKLSSRVPFAEQISSIRNVTVLWAGRGGGTAYSIFLPTGGVYISISGNDRWSPYRTLVPRWIHMVHQSATLVDHRDPNRPPQTFISKGRAFTDSNRAAYLVREPKKFAKQSVKLMRDFLIANTTSF